MADEPQTWRRRPNVPFQREIWRLRYPIVPCPELELVAALYHEHQQLPQSVRGEASRLHKPQPEADALAEKIHAASVLFRATQQRAVESAA